MSFLILFSIDVLFDGGITTSRIMTVSPSRLFPLPLVLAFLLSAVAQAISTTSELLKKQVTTLLATAELTGDEAAGFQETLLGSEEWQHELLDSGPVDDFTKVASHLMRLWKEDPGLVERPVDRGMATACALEGPGKNYDSDEVLRRYVYFRDKWQYGLLNTLYENLSVFERRYLARGVQHTGFNSAESMEYHNQEVCLPSEAYTGACWYARWILDNPFGDSIHGPLYYHPFHDSWESYAEVVKNVGGVCGSLSNFGAAAALANGVPAVTMGEPGHCAYAVMIKPGDWQPAYSLSWQRGMHTSFFGSSWGWHVFNTKAQEDVSATRKSADLRRLAKDYLAKGNVAKARETIQIARSGHPLDWQNWAESVSVLESAKGSDQDWQELHQDVLKHLAPVSGEVAFHFLSKSVYPKVLPNGDDGLETRRKVLLAFQNVAQDWGLGRWDYQRALEQQLKLLAGDEKASDTFMVSVFGMHAEKNLFTPEILALELKQIGDNHDRLNSFMAEISKNLAGGKSESHAGVIDTLAKTVLPDAAKRGDKEIFQYIGKLTAANYEAHPISPKPFPGILLSSGGTFGIQKPGNRWDVPARHWGVIEEYGGDFHTDATPATATVQLGNYGRLSGVVIVTRGGNVGRLNGAVLEVSIDGQEWTAVHTFEKVSQINRIDLSDQKIDAGYVRVIHPTSPSLHFHKFLIYGDKKN